jgi:hypothetical protein
MGVSEQGKGGGLPRVTAPRAARAAVLAKYLPEHVADPHVITRKMNSDNAAVAAKFGDYDSNPMLSGTILRNVVFSAGQTLKLKHGLGRPWHGYLIVRAQTNPAQMIDVANPSGSTGPDPNFLTLRSTNAGTYDVWIF